MSRTQIHRVSTVIFTALATLGFALPVLAGDGSGYDISSSTVDGGGAIVEAGGHCLRGTAGQPDAGELEGGGYTLNGGFWAGMTVSYPLYLPLIVRGAG